MKNWSENRFFALCGLMSVAGLLLAIATSDPRLPLGRLRLALVDAAQVAAVAVRP